MRMKHAWMLVVALVGCSSEGPAAGADDGGGRDAGALDRGAGMVDRGGDSGRGDLGRGDLGDSPDFGPPDADLPDLGRSDAELPDLAPFDTGPFDLGPPDADPDPPAPCPPFIAPPPGPAILRDTQLTAEIPLGAPPGPEALRALDLDGDAAPDLLIARGGRLDALDATGAERWRTPVLDLRRIIAARDLDGDGRLEIVAAADRAVFAFDALTGELRWRSPDAPFADDRRLTAVQRVDVLDLDGDAIDDLYLSDGGCGDEGTGRGVGFRFAGAVFGEPLGIVAGPRHNGRCGRWQVFADLDADDRPELLVTDGDGIAAFDPLTGARRRCGGFAAPPNGPLPHLPFGAARAAFLPDALVVFEPDAAGGDPSCPDGRLAERHRFALAATAAGSGVFEIDGQPALITSAFDAATGRWRVHRLAAGTAAVLIDDARLLGIVPGTSIAIAALAESAAPARFGALMAFDLATDPPTPRWPLPIPRARLVLDHAPADRTPEFEAPLTLPGVAGPDLLLLRTGLEDGLPTGLADRIERVDLAGQRVAAAALGGDPGGILPATGAAALVIGEPGGGVVLLDAALAPLAAPIPAPSGAAALMLGDGLFARTDAGVVARIDLDSERVRWQVALGAASRSAILAVDGDVLARDARVGDAAWAVLAGDDGALRWRHRLDPDHFRPIGDAVVATADGAAAMVVRADLVLRPAEWHGVHAVGVDAPCEIEWHPEPDPAAPAPECPGTEVRPRVVRGLDPRDGTCRWRLVLRPHFPCGGPSNQALSVADAEGDGREEVYLTETDAIRRIDAATGELQTTVGLGRHENGSVRGGGWIRAGEGALIRAGGNAPVEAFALDLTPRWQAENPPGLRLQGWIGRDAWIHAGAAWTSPATGFPLVRARIDDGAEVSRTGLLGGVGLPDAALEAAYSDLRGLWPLADLDGAPGALAVTDDGQLYALDAAGEVAWSRPHGAQVGAPVVMPIDPGGPRAIVLPAADGRVLVYGPPGPAAPPAVWDLPCPPRPSCDAADDIDATESTEQLCAAWIPLADAAGHEARVLGPGGAIVRGWTRAESPLVIDGLALAPGSRYAVEIRAVAEVDGRPRPSLPRASDGVQVVNDAPPRVAVVARPAMLVPAEQPVQIGVRAEEDDRLAGWRLDVERADGTPVRRLAGGPLAARIFEAEARWDLTDRDKRPVPPGAYRVVAIFIDRAGNSGRAETAVVVCDERCP